MSKKKQDDLKHGDNYLPMLAENIKAAHMQIGICANSMAEHTINTGRLLNEAKDRVKHGDWLAWLKEHVGISDRTARRYMAIFNSGLKTATVANLGIRGASVELTKIRRLTKLKLHPYCEIMPWVSEEKQASITESIRVHGLIYKITLFNEKILDGKIRYKSLLRLNAVTADCFRVFEGDNKSALEYSRSINMVRGQYSDNERSTTVKRLEAYKNNVELKSPTTLNPP
jgi:hypothetical protein